MDVCRLVNCFPSNGIFLRGRYEQDVPRRGIRMGTKSIEAKPPVDQEINI
jgi:hypothetical protein